MKLFTRWTMLGLVAAGGALLLGTAGLASATDFEVTVTNLTRGQQPMTALLLGNPNVRDVVNSGGLLGPGKSVTQRVSTLGGFDNVSVAAMLIPTNDGFFAVNDAEGPNGQESITVFSPAYDAGTERNDETCASIPGPFFVECGGPGGGGAPGSGEGYVHIHAGIHGIGDLDPALRDWRNPVARITIRRVNP